MQVTKSMEDFDEGGGGGCVIIVEPLTHPSPMTTFTKVASFHHQGVGILHVEQKAFLDKAPRVRCFFKWISVFSQLVILLNKD